MNGKKNITSKMSLASPTYDDSSKLMADCATLTLLKYLL